MILLMTAQLAGAIEHTERPLKESPGYDTQQSDGEVSVILELWGMRSTYFIAIAPKSTLARNGSIW